MRYVIAVIVGLCVSAAALGLYLGTQDGSLIDPDEPLAKPTPTCVDVWETGNTLPADYQGCVNQAGTFKPIETIECRGEPVVVFNRHGDWYAAPGNRIEATEDRPCSGG